MIEGVSLDIVLTDPDLGLRLAGPADEPFLRQLFREARAAQFISAGLSGPILDQIIEQQFRSQTAGYAGQFPDAISLIPTRNGTDIGRLLFHCTSERWHIIDIVLLAAERGRGVGTAIIEALEAGARRQHVGALTLSVLTSNAAARRFYLRQGFAEVGQAGAAHIVMRKILV